MPRRCTVCEHHARGAIDKALVGEASNLSISALFGVSESALRRHKSSHLPATLVLAEKAEEVAHADTLLGEVRDLQRRTMAVLARAERTHEHRTALAAIREARSNLELLAKLQGELGERPVVNLNISSEWLELRAVIVGALALHPDARESVLSAIEGGGNGHAR